MPRTKTVRLDPEVLDVLQCSTITERSVTLPEQLDRALYTKVAKALDAAGGKWNRKAGCHLFEVDPRSTLTLDAGVVVHRQQTLQRFDTPDAIAERVVELADVKPDHACLEPSVGGGSILRALERRNPRSIMAIDIDETAITALQRDCLAERLNHRGNIELVCMDFLPWATSRARASTLRFDRIVMNPPFTGGQDAAHVCAAFELVPPGGVLVAIVAPASLTKPTRPFARLQGLVRAYGDFRDTLPRGTFADTNVETALIRLRAGSAARQA